MFRAAPAAGPDSPMVLSILPALLLLLFPPMKPGIMLDVGRRLSRGAAALVCVMPNALLFLGAGAGTGAGVGLKAVFSSSALEYSSFSLFFLPRNQRSSAAMIPMMAMIPIAKPALAPVDIPPLLELELEVESEESDVDAAPATAVLEARSELAAEVRKVVLEKATSLDEKTLLDETAAELKALLLGEGAAAA